MIKYPSTNFLRNLFFGLMLINSVLVQGVNSLDSKEDNYFNNIELLNTVFDKLYALENNQVGKINIVHIGDSHIQADFFTNTIRQNLQNKFGNGGYGFTFPYTLAKTNGTDCVTYTSNVIWESKRNIFPVTDISVGLSGIGLYTDDPDFSINLKTIPMYDFNVIKILYPSQDSQFRIILGSNIQELSQAEKEKLSTNVITKAKQNRQKVIHTVKPKETLYKLCVNYKVSLDDIKKVNNLTSNTIKVGSKLIIPSKEGVDLKIVEKKETKITKDTTHIVTWPSFSTIPVSTVKPYCSTFSFAQTQNEVSIISNSNNDSDYNLSGMILENDQPGLIYHSIGVNGTKASDYNKYPLFFEQLPNLNPDLLIISLGTNESFGKWSTLNYISQMQLFINKVKEKNPNTVILLMTPPPSLFKRRKPNTFVADYSEAVKSLKDCVIWNLFDKLGGVDAPNQISLSPLMAKDRVHYTRDGYKMQGDLFSSEFISAYDDYIKNKTNWTQ